MPLEFDPIAEFNLVKGRRKATTPQVVVDRGLISVLDDEDSYRVTVKIKTTGQALTIFMAQARPVKLGEEILVVRLPSGGQAGLKLDALPSDFEKRNTCNLLLTSRR